MSRERKKINLKKMTRKQKILAVVVLAVAVFGITRACGGKKEADAPGAFLSPKGESLCCVSALVPYRVKVWPGWETSITWEAYSR